MFVSPIVDPEEVKEFFITRFGKKMKLNPGYLKSAQGKSFEELVNAQGFNMSECFYTSVVRYLPEELKLQKKPSNSLLKEGLPALEYDIRTVKPKIIVCLGKQALDVIHPMKMKEAEMRGMWFDSRKYNCKVYLMPATYKLYTKPELIFRFESDLQIIRRMYDRLKGAPIHQTPIEHITIRNSQQLRELVNRLKEENRTLISVDCEWHGNTHVDGKLRSFQMAWDVGRGACVRFMDDQLNYAFDVSYKEAGAILSEWLDTPDVKYIGHHISADLPWMYYWLGLDWYNKAIFDSEFALQCVDEGMPRGLDDLALMYTDLGRYDQELAIWKSKNAAKCKEGFGYIPDEIIIPYSIYDCDVVFRSFEPLKKELETQGLLDYYNNLFNPFSTNVFTQFAINGLPMDRDRMDLLRDIAQYSRKELEIEFRKAVAAEAEVLLKNELDSVLGYDTEKVFQIIHRTVLKGESGKAQEMLKTLTKEHWNAFAPFFEHYIDSPAFNIRSAPMMRKWLFSVKRYEPVKSTKNLNAGLPATPWERVKQLPPEKAKLFTPACDKQVLSILNDTYQDPVLELLLELNAIGNICKAFLKEADIDEDTGEVIGENGLHYWIASDGCAHVQTSSTETGRPRTWKPNVLNWPSYLHKKVEAAFKRILTLRHEQGNLPDKFVPYLDVSLIPTVRSCVQSAPGWCIVESDYQAAEMRGQAVIPGDPFLMDLMDGVNPCFAVVKKEARKNGTKICRIKFPDFLPKVDEWDKYLLTATEKGEIKATYTWDDLERDATGNLVHPGNDIHWDLAERVKVLIRDLMDPKKDRGGIGKTGNFSTAYAISVEALKRKLEEVVGEPVPLEIVEKLLQVIEERAPETAKYMKMLEEWPKAHMELRAASGRIRHLNTTVETYNYFDERVVSGYMSSLGRECRNFIFQESVAATAARAGNWLLAFKRTTGLEGSPLIILYDAVASHCPYEERMIWSKAHKLYMFLLNAWQYDDRVLRYPIDNEINKGWSTPASNPILHKNLLNPSWRGTPERLKNIENWLDAMIEKYEHDEWLALQDSRVS